MIVPKKKVANKIDHIVRDYLHKRLIYMFKYNNTTEQLNSNILMCTLYIYTLYILYTYVVYMYNT